MQDPPDAVRAKARDAGVTAWLAELPALLDRLASRWSLRLGTVYPDATEAYVVAATRADGTPAVVKLLVPGRGPAAAREIAVLRAADGHGCARLLAAEVAANALLLERLGPSMSTLSLPQPQRLRILCDLAVSLWRPAYARGEVAGDPAAPLSARGEVAGDPAAPLSARGEVAGDPAAPLSARGEVAGDPAAPLSARGEVAGLFASEGLPSGAEQAERLAASIPRKWSALGEPCTRRTIEHALAAAESRRRAHDPARAVLVHGDIHQWNALLTAAAPADSRSLSAADFRLVDPDGLIAEPEYDLGVLMREDPVELLAGDPWSRATWLADRTGTDPQAIWEWGIADRVATGLTLATVGLQPLATEMLTAADEISAI